MVTAPDVITYRGLQVDVLVEVPVNKPVFVGLGNTVDVQDYLAGTRRLEVTSFRAPWTVRTAERRGRAALPGAPTALDWWIADSAGLGGASISTTLPDTPVSLAILAVGASDLSGLRVTFAYGVRGGFGLGLGALLGGLGLIWSGLLLRRGPSASSGGLRRPWRERGDGPLEVGEEVEVVEEEVYVFVDERGVEHEITAEEAARLQERLAADALEPTGPDRAGGRALGGRREAGPMSRRSAPVVVLLACVLVLTSCTVPRPRDDRPASTVPIDRAGVEQVLSRYDQVREAAAKLLDPKPLSTVESGAVLAIDTGSFDVAQRLSRGVGSDGTSDQVERLAVPRFTAYPLWFVVEVRDQAAKVNRVQVFERGSAVDPWFLVASPETVLSTRLPDLRERDGAALTVDPRSATGMSMSPQQAADRYAAALEDPSTAAARTIENDDFRAQMRTAARRNAALDGVRLTWPDDSPQKALLESGVSSSGRLRYLHQVLVEIPGGSGRPRVIGQYGGVVEAEGP